MIKGDKRDIETQKEPVKTKKSKKREEIALKNHQIRPQNDNFCKIFLREAKFNSFLNFSKSNL